MGQKISWRVICYLITTLVVIDQITKLVFSSRDFFPPEDRSLLGLSPSIMLSDPPLAGFFRIHPVHNYGLAFSLDFGYLPNLLLVIFALLFFLYYYLSFRNQLGFFTKIFFVLIFAGALSNLIDRLYLGYVRDFMDLGLGFTFNLADIFLAVGLIGFVFQYKETKTDLSRDF